MTDDPAWNQPEITPVTASDCGVTVGAWTRLLRRARIGLELKSVGYAIASYADPDGTNIHCGVAALAVDLEMGYSTVRRYLARLRDAGLLQVVRPGNARRGFSDEYRLVIEPHAEDWLKALSVDGYREAKDEVKQGNRDGQKGRRSRIDQRSPKLSADSRATDTESPPLTDDQRSLKASAGSTARDAPEAEVSALAVVSAETAISAHLGADQRSPMGEPPPSLITSPLRTTYPPGGSAAPSPPRPKVPPSSGPWTETPRSPLEGRDQPLDVIGDSRPRARVRGDPTAEGPPQRTDELIEEAA